MTKQDAVGIDLGTTNSAVAWIDEKGRTEMIQNAEGEILTPSVVWFDSAETIVGRQARSAAAVQPGEVARWVKRDMGSEVYHRPVHGKYFPPEVIQACVLRKLRDDLAEAIPGASSVVITVPAYFDEPRRKATTDAGEMAGLDVLDIINEPTAAALAFGERLGYLSDDGGGKEPMTLLVYDLGGGTFDVTLLRLAPGDVRTLATDGDVQLGGHDWDLRLLDHAAEAFVDSGGADPRQDPVAFARLYAAVEEAKHTLSARSLATIHFEHRGHTARIDVSGEDFNERTADLLERTSYTTRQVLTAAGLKWSDVDRVLLVGGSTRMPMVAAMLQSLTGITADRTVNPDEAVARGAALYAGYLLRQQSAAPDDDDFQLTNVNSHSLGIEGIDPETMRKMNVTLIPRNTPLPATFAEQFTTKRADQRSIVVQVLEGEGSHPDNCTAIGRTVIRDLPPRLPQGSTVEVIFDYASNGRLAVRASVSGTGREVTLNIERAGGLTDERIAQWKAPVAAGGGFDDFVLGVLADASPPATALKTFTPSPPPATPPASPTADSPSSSPVADAVKPSRTGKRTSISRPMIFLIGYILSAVVGLGAGYLLVQWISPDSGLPRLW